MHYAAAPQIGPPMSDSPLPDIDPAQVTTWPGAVVAIALIAGTIILAVIVVQNRRLEKRLGKTNHGSHNHGEAIDALREAVDGIKVGVERVEASQAELNERLAKVEARPALALFGRR